MKIQPNQPYEATQLNQSILTKGQSVFKADGDLFKPLDSIGQWEQGEAQNKSRARWHRESLPLTVTLEDPPAALAFCSGDELCQLLLTALKQWEIASQGLLRFQLSQTSGDVQFKWTQTPTVGREFELGHTDRNVQGLWIRQATITLLLAPEIDRHLSLNRQKQRLYSTLLHELGHALGLEHTEAKQDVMHHQGWQNLCLSPNDGYQLQTLYAKSTGFSL